MLLLGCFTAQKLYGRDPGSLDSVNQVFHTVLAKYPADKVLRAFEIHLERSNEFPTPADIVSFIKRGGKPPFSKETYISISKKDPELRSKSDWVYLREYEADQMQTEFGGDEPKTEILQDNVRLRERVKFLEGENDRLIDLLNKERGIEYKKPSLTAQEKAIRTIAVMRKEGAAPEDIMQFAQMAGVQIDA